jgi:hypothetical protein
MLIILTFSGCSSYEKIGYFEYKVQIDSINTGDFDGLIETMKFYHRNNKSQLGIIIKSQKLHFQSSNDSIYSSASLKFNKSNHSLLVTEKFFNGYDKYQHIDSIQRTYKQDEKGNLIMIQHKYYNTK